MDHIYPNGSTNPGDTGDPFSSNVGSDLLQEGVSLAAQTVKNLPAM